MNDGEWHLRTTNNDDFVVLYCNESPRGLVGSPIFKSNGLVFTFRETTSEKMIHEFLDNKYIPDKFLILWDDVFDDDRPIINDADIQGFKQVIKNMNKEESDPLPLWLIEILILYDLRH